MRIKEILTQLIISKCKKGKIAAQLTIAKSSDDFNTEALELLGCVFLFYAGTYTIKAILTGLGLEAYRRVGSLVFYCLWAFHLLKLVLKNTGILKRILVFEGIYCLILICNLALAPKTAQYYWEYYTFIRQILVVFLPCGAVLSKVTNFDNGFSYMVKYAWIGMILMIISLPLGYISTIGEQYWGVHLTPFAIIFWCSYFRSKKPIELSMAIAGLTLALFGGRQSLVILVAAFFAIYIFDHRENKKMMLLFFVATVLIGIIFITGAYKYIFSALYTLCSTLGIEGRAFKYLANGQLLDFSTRTPIYDLSLKLIGQQGIRAAGLFGDRYLLRNYAANTRWITYAHNIYLELLLDFGLLFGTAISVWLTYKVLDSIFDGDPQRRRLCLVMAMIVFLRLSVSSSFMIEGYFYVILGLLWGKRSHPLELIRSIKCRFLKWKSCIQRKE